MRDVVAQERAAWKDLAASLEMLAETIGGGGTDKMIDKAKQRVEDNIKKYKTLHDERMSIPLELPRKK